MTETPSSLKSGVVSLVGRANVGKSTLMNRILGEKVSIVSPIAQTTRNAIRGVLTEERGQLVFLDTPGVHKATHDLGKLMNKTARASIEGADVAVLVLDVCTPPRDEDEGWMRKLIKSDVTLLLAMNKHDRKGPKYDADYLQRFEALIAVSPEPRPTPPIAIPVSAATGQGVDHFLTTLFEHTPSGPPLMDEELLTDFPRRLAIADVIREKLFLHLKNELPHAIAVNVTELKESEKRWDVDADILVNRQSQKYIVIGKKGGLLKDARAKAERELSEMFDIRVKLHLWVKVEKHWARNFWILKQLGHT